MTVVSTTAQSPELQSRLADQQVVVHELARRSLPGAFVYAAMILLMYFSTPYYTDHPTVILLVGSLSLVLGSLRFASARRLMATPIPVQGETGKWLKRILLSSTVLISLLWGGFAAASVHYYGTEWTGMFALLAAAAFAAGASGAHSPDFRLATVCVCLLILPTTIYAVYGWGNLDERGVALAIGCATYLAFLIAQARENWRTFWAVSLAAEKDRVSGSVQLREREAHNRALLEAVPDLILSVDSDGTVLDHKPAIGKAANPWPGFAPGIKIGDVMPGEIGQTMTHHIAEALLTNEVQAFRFHVASAEEPFSRHFYARMSVSAGRQVLAVIQEITEQVHLEADLRHSQKIESAGKLAGGIAHDFNNLLTVINGNAEVALESLAPSDPLIRPVNEIVQAGERAAQLTRQLLTFSRKELTALKVLSLNVPVRECLDLFGRMLGEKVQLVATLDPALADVMADSGQIHQILMNLVLNAGTAMPRGGRLGISTANLPVPSSQLSVPAEVPPGSYVLLSVSDTGIGIDPELRERIFEPFFTTRQTGHGLGLGLTTVFGIVERHNGWIFLESTPGVGSTFHILLPRTLSGRVDETAPSEHPSHAGKTVLVVEDDEQVRQLAVTILERTGYHVLSAGMGGDALLMAERYAGQIDLMLTDAIMPYMNGRELAERLTVLRPGLRVLFMSGYSENVITQSDVSGGINFIAKPFTAPGLRQKLAEVLAAPPYQSASSPAPRDAGS